VFSDLGFILGCTDRRTGCSPDDSASDPLLPTPWGPTQVVVEGSCCLQAGEPNRPLCREPSRWSLDGDAPAMSGNPGPAARRTVAFDEGAPAMSGVHGPAARLVDGEGSSRISQEHPRNIQGTSEEHPRNIRGTSKEHPRNIQGTCKEHPRSIQVSALLGLQASPFSDGTSHDTELRSTWSLPMIQRALPMIRNSIPLSPSCLVSALLGLQAAPFSDAPSLGPRHPLWAPAGVNRIAASAGRSERRTSPCHWSHERRNAGPVPVCPCREPGQAQRRAERTQDKPGQAELYGFCSVSVSLEAPAAHSVAQSHRTAQLSSASLNR
jgi:hypothetical protein